MAKPKLVSSLGFKGTLHWILVLHFWQKWWEISTHGSGSWADFKKKGGCGGQHSWCAAVYYFITIIFILCVGWYTSTNSESTESTTSSTFVFNIVNGHYLQLRCCLLVFHDFKEFNVKAIVVHHPVTQQAVDELLARGTIGASTGGGNFYSNVCLAPKHTVGLHPILNL